MKLEWIMFTTSTRNADYYVYFKIFASWTGKEFDITSWLSLSAYRSLRSAFFLNVILKLCSYWSYVLHYNNEVYSPYSHDLVPCDFWLFLTLKEKQCSRKLNTDSEAISAMLCLLKLLPERAATCSFHYSFWKLWDHCISYEGRYLEIFFIFFINIYLDFLWFYSQFLWNTFCK